jgi:hypothetical protein
MEIITWFLTLLTGFLFSFIWRELKDKLYKNVTIFDELKKYGLIKTRDPMEERLIRLEGKIDAILSNVKEIENIRTSLIRLENRVNESLNYLQDINDIKEEIEDLKEGVTKLAKLYGTPILVKKGEKEDNKEDNEEEDEDNEEEEIDNLLLEIKKREESKLIEEKKREKIDVMDYLLSTNPEEYFNNPNFFPIFQEEIKRKDLPKTQAIIELLAIKKLPPIDNKAPLLKEVYEKLDNMLTQTKGVAFVLGPDIINMVSLQIANVAFLIILLGTHQEERIPEVFEVEPDYTIKELLKKIGI